jgi:phage baseplate assembly protein W
MSNTFIGFSTSNLASGRRSWVLYDVELIKRDLYNHFYTRIGERVMRPEFGSRLWEFIMEPNLASMRGLIVSEVERVIRLDSRLEVKNVRLFDNGNQVTITCELLYRPFETIENFSLEFDKRQEVA